MLTVTAKEAKTHFGKLLDDVKRQPALITKNGRPTALMIDLPDEKLGEMLSGIVEDYQLSLMAQDALIDGLATDDEVAEVMGMYRDDEVEIYQTGSEIPKKTSSETA